MNSIAEANINYGDWVFTFFILFGIIGLIRLILLVVKTRKKSAR